VNVCRQHSLWRPGCCVCTGPWPQLTQDVARCSPAQVVEKKAAKPKAEKKEKPAKKEKKEKVGPGRGTGLSVALGGRPRWRCCGCASPDAVRARCPGPSSTARLQHALCGAAQDPNAPKRALGSYMFFSADKRGEVGGTGRAAGGKGTPCDGEIRARPGQLSAVVYIVSLVRHSLQCSSFPCVLLNATASGSSYPCE
jgi:hypothetical protein